MNPVISPISSDPLDAGEKEATVAGPAELVLRAEAPTSYSTRELKAFEKLILEGGEVSSQGLAERIRSAAVLIMLSKHGMLIGIAALKRPEPGYRVRVAEKSGVSVTAAGYPYELGWVYVIPAESGSKHSYRLMDAAVVAGGVAGIFATTRTDNGAMHHILPRYGFLRVGAPYKSSRGNYCLTVFVRSARKTGGPLTEPNR